MKKTEGPRIVLVGGCFDVIHVGHVLFLAQAKQHGDYLIVALESDGNVKRRKGSGRPIHPQPMRKTLLENLRMVDEVYTLPDMKSDSEYLNLVIAIKPDVIATTEGDPYLVHKQKQAEHIGATVVSIPNVPTPSTSQLAKLLLID